APQSSGSVPALPNSASQLPASTEPISPVVLSPSIRQSLITDNNDGFFPASLVGVLEASASGESVRNRTQGDVPLDLLLSGRSLPLFFEVFHRYEHIPSSVDLDGQGLTTSRAVSTGSIVGTIFEDTNGDGVRQGDELPLEGMGVFLDVGDSAGSDAPS